MAERSYPHGVPCWVDTDQPDVEAAIGFYGGLFGWTFEDAMPPGAPGRYVIAKLDGQDVGAIGGPTGPSSGGTSGGTTGEVAAWNTYVAVDDTDVAVAHLVGLGASVRSEPADAGEGGRGAVLADPEGIEIRLWQARRRLGAQVVNQPGAWNFSDLHTSDAGAAGEFYEPAFGWEVADLGFATIIRRPGYGDHLAATVDPGIKARQEEVGAPPGFEDAIAWVTAVADTESPRWHVSFSIADRDATVADAERLGASVLDQDDNGWTRTALIRDPQGAEFTASQFTPPS